MVVILTVWGALVGVFTLINYLFDLGQTACLFKNATGGIPCPTCGSTRVVLFAATGRILSAFLQSPFVFLFSICVLIWLIAAYGFKRRIELVAPKKVRWALFITIAAIFLLNWGYVVLIDGPWENDLKTDVQNAQMHERGIYRFFDE